MYTQKANRNTHVPVEILTITVYGNLCVSVDPIPMHEWNALTDHLFAFPDAVFIETLKNSNDG
jgi:hypothetical protein